MLDLLSEPLFVFCYKIELKIHLITAKEVVMKIRDNILLQYTGGLLVVTLVLGFALSFFMNNWTEEQTISHHIDLYPEIIRQKIIANPSIVSFFAANQQDYNERDVHQFYDEIKSFGKIFRVKVWGENAVILWSDDKNIIGSQFPDNKHYREAWTGRLSYSVSRPEKSEHASETGQAVILEIYTPVLFEHKVVGVIELYESAGDLFAQIEEENHYVLTLVAIGGILFYILLFSIFYRAQSRMKKLEKLGRLKRFLSPALAESIVSGEEIDIYKPHRRDVTVVFLDLRGFTAFTESFEPEEVMNVLKDYHFEMGSLIQYYEGTIEHFAGDGIMVVFNDPQPVPNPTERAVRMALKMRERIEAIKVGWHRHGYTLDCGFGIAYGYATIGAIGFEGRLDYTTIGNVANLAARLCAEAGGGQILINQKTLLQVEQLAEAEVIGDLHLKGFSKPVVAYNIKGIKSTAT